jgi:hypothetical protein
MAGEGESNGNASGLFPSFGPKGDLSKSIFDLLISRIPVSSHIQTELSVAIPNLKPRLQSPKN